MAYRTFRNEETYAAPDIKGLPNTLAALDTYARVQQQKKQRQYDLQNNWKSYQTTNKIPSITRKLNQELGIITQLTMNAFGAGYQTQPQELRVRMDKAIAQDKEAVALEENIKRLENDIKERAAQDPYYRPNYDLEKLKQLTQDNDLPIEEELAQKNKLLLDLSSSIGKDLRQTFDRDKALADWYNSQGKGEIETEYIGPDGAKSKKYVSARLFDDKGVPNVTDQHIAQAFDKDPRLYQSFQQDAVDKITSGWNEYKASGSTLPVWTKGLTDQDIVAELVNDPQKQKDIGLSPKNLWDLVADEARPALKRMEDASVKSYYDESKRNPGWGYGFTSNKINPPTEGFNTSAYSGPSWNVTTKSNASPYLMFDAVTKAKVDPTTGQITTSQTPTKMVLNNVHWGPYYVDANGNKIPLPIQALNMEEMIQKLNALTPAQRAGLGVAPIANGYSIDKANVIAQSHQKLDELQDILDQSPEDPAAQAKVEQLEGLIEDMNAGRDVNPQLLQKLVGVDIMRPTSFVMEPKDQNTAHFQSRTGADLFSDKAKTPEMKRLIKAVEEASSKGKQELPAYKEEGLKENVKKIKEASKLKLKTITTQEEYDKLPSGTEYIGSDGKTYKKK